MNNNINKESWNKIVIKNHGSPLHSWEWIKSIENDGLKVKWFYLNNKNGYVAVPIIEKYKVFGWIPFGIPFSGDLQFVKNNFKKFILKSKLIGIITNNYKTFNGSKLPSSLFHFFLKKKTETITLDFTNKTNEELFNGFNSTS